MRIQDLGLVAKTNDPAEEHRRNGHLNGEIKMLLSIGDQHGIFAKPVDNHIEKTPVEPHLHIQSITGVHLEQPVCVIVECFSGQFRAGDSVFFCQLNVSHAIHPVGGNSVTAGEGQQVAIFIILAQSVRTCQVFFVSVFPLAAKVPVKITERDLLVLGDGFLNGIHIVVDGLIHTLDPSGDQDGSAHQFGILLVTLGTQLFNQFSGLLFC